MTQDELYRENYAIVYGFLLSLCGNVSIAEDLAAETFLKALLHAHRYDGSCKPSTWLCAIAKNVLANHIRKQKRTSEKEVPEPTDASAEEYQATRYYVGAYDSAGDTGEDDRSQSVLQKAVLRYVVEKIHRVRAYLTLQSYFNYWNVSKLFLFTTSFYNFALKLQLFWYG